MNSYGILGEDKSDSETLEVLVRRLAGRDVRVRPYGFSGCGELLARGAAKIALFKKLGYQRFVISYDADREDPAQRRQIIMEKIVWPSESARDCCVIIPVQEIEAWILADIEAVRNVIPSWRTTRFNQNPEAVNDPKEHLERLSRSDNKKPRYAHAVHNPRVAEHLNLDVVRQRCPSFRPLAEWISTTENQSEN